MNILREFRKVKNKSPIARVRIIVILLLMLIMSTYAWWWCRTEQFIPIQGVVNSWEVYYVDAENHLLNEEVTMQIDNFFPGSNKNEVILIKNMGVKPTNVKVEISSIKIYFEGEEVDILKDIDEETNTVIDKGTSNTNQLNTNKKRESWEYALYDRLFTCSAEYTTHLDGNPHKLTDYVDTVYNSPTTNIVYSNEVLENANVIRNTVRDRSILPKATNSDGEEIDLPESKVDISVDWIYEEITDAIKKEKYKNTYEFDKIEITFTLTSEIDNTVTN